MRAKRQSEFGKGLVICLVKFAEHAERWFKQKNLYAEMRKKHPKDDLFSEHDAVEMFFNGASDHLYGIQVPEKWKGTKIEKKVNELQSFGLSIGHGFKRDRIYSQADVVKAYDLCREIAMLIDKEIGLKPDLGQW